MNREQCHSTVIDFTSPLILSLISMHEADVLYCNQIMGFLFYFKATTTEAGEWDDWKLRRGWHFEWVYHNLKGDKLSAWTYIEE